MKNENRKHRPDGLAGIRNEIDGMKHILHELQTMCVQLDMDMRKDMGLLQRKLIGLESRLEIDGNHEYYKRYRKRIHHGTQNGGAR